jgi:hypothetical protein
MQNPTSYLYLVNNWTISGTENGDKSLNQGHGQEHTSLSLQCRDMDSNSL